MTQTEALSELRAMLNEATAGFYLDDELYKFLNSGQLEIVTLAYSKQLAMQKVDPGYQSDILRQLETVSTPVGVSTPTDYTNLPSDFLFILSATIAIDSGELRSATRLNHSDFIRKEENSFTKATISSPKYYILGTKLYFRPTYINEASVGFVYVKNPSTVSSSQDFTLSAESHLPIIWLAYSYALAKNQRLQESVTARQTAFNLIKDL